MGSCVAELRWSHQTGGPPKPDVQISPPLPPPPEKIILRGVHFDFNKSNIRPQDAAVLDEAAETLKSHPNVTVNVNGYCDAIGSVRYNLGLSERRANAVVRYLADHEGAEGRIKNWRAAPRGQGAPLSGRRRAERR